MCMSLRFRPVGEVAKYQQPHIWLFKHHLSLGDLADFFGVSGDGKTFVLTDMACHIGSDMKEWHGIPIGVNGPVFILLGEGQSAYIRRILAWCQYHRIDPDHVRVFVSNRAAQFNCSGGLDEVINAIDELVEEHGEPVFIVIDTIARNFTGDENYTSDVSQFVSEIDTVRLRYNCTVACAHHTGLADKNRARGASALRAAMGWEYKVSKNSDKQIVLTCTKAKDFVEPSPLVFDTKTIEIDGLFDLDDLSPLTSLILQRVEGTSNQRPLYGALKVAYESLVGLGGYAHVDVWRDAAYTAGISASSQEARKKAFQRSVTALRNAGLVDSNKGFYWVTGQDKGGTLEGHVPGHKERDIRDNTRKGVRLVPSV